MKVKGHERKIGRWVLLNKTKVYGGDKIMAPHEIVLRKHYKGGGYKSFTGNAWEYATHEHNLEDDGYYLGHYFVRLFDARRDYKNRIEDWTT